MSIAIAAGAAAALATMNARGLGSAGGGGGWHHEHRDAPASNARLHRRSIRVFMTVPSGSYGDGLRAQRNPVVWRVDVAAKDERNDASTVDDELR